MYVFLKVNCTLNGEFEPIQRYKDFSWCVDEKGKEIPGILIKVVKALKI